MIEPEQLRLRVGHEQLEVRVVRSSRRTKTAEARMKGAILEVLIPARLSPNEEFEMIEHFRAKFERRREASLHDLRVRSDLLAEHYDLPRPASIRWVSNQRQRWGSCTPTDGSIRLSDRLASFPEWVIDYVIVHELAHLVEFGHTPRFWSIVQQYPLTERARGFLIAKGWED